MPPDELPTEVMNLYRREREIAEIVFEKGERGVTAKCVQASLSDSLTNAAVRSMLNRLVRKGVIGRTRTDEDVQYVYHPRATCAGSTERAIRQFADDFFGGSLQEVAASVHRLSMRQNGAQLARPD